MIKANKIMCKCYLVLMAFAVFACQTENNSIDVYSYKIDDKTEKTETLKKYLKEDSGLIEAEYHIWRQDNGTGRVPGPSDYNIELALKIEADSINSWISHLEPSPKKISIDLWNELKLDPSLWNLKSEPELYHSSLFTEVKLLFRKESIVLAIYSTMPINLQYLDE